VGTAKPRSGARIKPTAQAVGKTGENEQAPEERKNSCDPDTAVPSAICSRESLLAAALFDA